MVKPLGDCFAVGLRETNIPLTRSIRTPCPFAARKNSVTSSPKCNYPLLDHEVALPPAATRVLVPATVEAAQEPLQPFARGEGHELPLPARIGLFLGLEADALIHVLYATFIAFSTFSFSNAWRTTSIISVTYVKRMPLV